MAKNKKSRRRRDDDRGSPRGEPGGESGERHPADARAEPVGGGMASAAALTAPGRSAFSMYKPGQGYWTRLGTALGAGVVLVFGAHYVWTQIPETRVVLHIGIPALFLALSSALLYWVVGTNRTSNDFFIATEGEMKKVSWSTQGEVIGSTKVVLVFTLFTAMLMFVVDILFMVFFGKINVLQIDIMETLFGRGA